jgi:WD40 repeat protein
VAALGGFQGQTVQLLFFGDGRTLAAAGSDQAIRLWDISDPAAIPPPRVLLGNELEVWRLALLPDNRTLISGAKDGTVHFWDTAAPLRPRGRSTVPGGPFAGFAFTSAGTALVTCDTTGRVVEWSGPRFSESRLLIETTNSVRAACLLPDRAQVALTLGDDSLQYWSWSKDRPAASWRAPFTSTNLLPYGVAGDWEWSLHRHGSRLAVGRFDLQTIYEVDLESGGLQNSWRAPGTLVDMDFTPDDRYCAMGGYRGQILVHDFATGTTDELDEFVPNIGDVAISPSGQWLAISSEQGYARIWQTDSWRPIAQLGGFLHAVGGLAFSPDNRRLAAGSTGREAVRLYDLEHLQPLVTLEGDRHIHRLAFDPSGNLLAGLDVQGRLHIWQAPPAQAVP